MGDIRITLERTSFVVASNRQDGSPVEGGGWGLSLLARGAGGANEVSLGQT